MTNDTVEDCLRLQRMYEEKLGHGPYPTSEVEAMRVTDSDSGTLLMYLADVAGIASHGPKLLGLEVSRREQFERVVAESFATKWPQIAQQISLDQTPQMHRLMSDTEEARLLIKNILESY